MGFQIVAGADKKIYPGQLIEYKVSPLFGIKMTWITQITQAQAPHYFVDEQLTGPYKFGIMSIGSGKLKVESKSKMK